MLCKLLFNRPIARQEPRGGKKNFINKHKMYCFKTEVSAILNDIEIGCTKNFPGSASDIERCRENENFHIGALSKTDDEEDYSYYMGPLVDEYGNQRDVFG